MQIYRYSSSQKLLSESVVALGFFDGVHAGHRSLLKSAQAIATEKGLTFTVFTFPAEALLKGDGVIYSTEQKLEILDSLGVEAVVLADFASLCAVSPTDFVHNVLIGDLGCKVAVCGEDFRFGHRAAGDAMLLQRLLSESGRSCAIEKERRIDGEKISTTRIKELLGSGNVEAAAEFLGAPYFMNCVGEHGNGVGKALGFPTVNGSLAGGIAPIGCGVYRTVADISGKLYNAVTNIGVCPTFEQREKHAETHIIDFSGDIYGQSIRIFFLGYLRDEIKFDDPQSLVLQINVDKSMAIKRNGELTWQEIGPSLQQSEKRNS